MVVMPVILALGRSRWEDRMSKASLGYIAITYIDRKTHCTQCGILLQLY